MKFTTKSASILLAILASSTIGGTMVIAAEGDGAKALESTGTVEVKQATDTGGPSDKGDIEDPEKEGPVTPKDKDVIDQNKEKGPLKVEQVSKLNFGSIEPQAKDSVYYADTVEMENGEERGALIQFADVRADVYGYTLKVAMTEQFKNTEDKKLAGSTIVFNNGIMKPEAGNGNTPGTFAKESDIVIGEDGEAQEVIKATTDQGKGRYVLEFGQSADFEKVDGTVGTGTKDSAKEAVQLKIPNKTSSNMRTGKYTAKITWSLVTEP